MAYKLRATDSLLGESFENLFNGVPLEALAPSGLYSKGLPLPPLKLAYDSSPIPGLTSAMYKSEGTLRLSQFYHFAKSPLQFMNGFVNGTKGRYPKAFLRYNEASLTATIMRFESLFIAPLEISTHLLALRFAVMAGNVDSAVVNQGAGTYFVTLANGHKFGVEAGERLYCSDQQWDQPLKSPEEIEKLLYEPIERRSPLRIQYGLRHAGARALYDYAKDRIPEPARHLMLYLAATYPKKFSLLGGKFGGMTDEQIEATTIESDLVGKLSELEDARRGVFETGLEVLLNHEEPVTFDQLYAILVPAALSEYKFNRRVCSPTEREDVMTYEQRLAIGLALSKSMGAPPQKSQPRKSPNELLELATLSVLRNWEEIKS